MPTRRRNRLKMPVFSRLAFAWLSFAAGFAALSGYILFLSDKSTMRIALPVIGVERLAPPTARETRKPPVRVAAPDALADRDAVAAAASTDPSPDLAKDILRQPSAGAEDDENRVRYVLSDGDNDAARPTPSADEGENGVVVVRGGQVSHATYADAGSSARGANAGDVFVTIDGERSLLGGGAARGAFGAKSSPRQSDKSASSDAPRRARPTIALASPDKSLTTKGAFGPVPIIAPDGRRAADLYARPFYAPLGERSRAPRIAMIVGGLGLNPRLTARAIDELPPETTLAFAPYAKDIAVWAKKARAAGHEVMLEAPMEHSGDAAALGPAALLTSRSWSDNAQRLDWIMSRFEGYFGVTNYLGAKYSGDAKALSAVIDRLKSAGLVYVDDTGAARRHRLDEDPAVATVDRLIAPSKNDAAIGGGLEKLESAAQRDGLALGKTYLHSGTIDELADWAWALEKRGILLAPASAVLKERARAL